MKKKRIFLFLLVFLAIGLGTGIYFYLRIFGPNLRLENSREEHYLYIPAGATFENVRDSLTTHEFLKNMNSFGWVARLMEYPANVKPGRYRLKKGMSNRSLITMLRAGEQDPVSLTFNNIRTKENFAGFIGRELEPDSGDFIALLNDTSFASDLGFSTETIYTMFIPNTYKVFWNTGAGDFFKRMNQEYERFWNPARLKQADSIKLSPQEVSILASIVDQETNKADEMPTVAGVYMNRLNAGRRLEADPTVIFATGDFSIRRVLNRHLVHPSPYNTYVHAGLPPGPITMPSVSAINAVLGYEHHDYFYFCAKADFSGYHAFAETLSQHLQNARAFQKALNERNILR